MKAVNQWPSPEGTFTTPNGVVIITPMTDKVGFNVFFLNTLCDKLRRDTHPPLWRSENWPSCSVRLTEEGLIYRCQETGQGFLWHRVPSVRSCTYINLEKSPIVEVRAALQGIYNGFYANCTLSEYGSSLYSPEAKDTDLTLLGEGGLPLHINSQNEKDLLDQLAIKLREMVHAFALTQNVRIPITKCWSKPKGAFEVRVFPWDSEDNSRELIL